MAIFQKSVVKRHLNNFDKEQVHEIYKKFIVNFTSDNVEILSLMKKEINY